MKKITLFFILLFFISFFVNIYFYFLLNGDNQEKEKEIKENINYININLFPESLVLKDYSKVDNKLTEEGKKLIYNIRQFHNTPTLINATYKDKEVCAGYVWSLSEKLWGKDIPFYIGMMDRETRKPAASWELESSYEYLGGKSLIDFSKKIDLSNFETNFYDKISSQDFLEFFHLAFSEEALLGDIGFLYKDTKYLKGLYKEGVYNSHITKNMGLSKFSKTINFSDNLDNHLYVLTRIFNADKNYISNYLDVISSYKFYLNDKPIVFNKGSFYYLLDDDILGDKVMFKEYDELSYNDVTLVHFFDSLGRVNGLLDFILSGEFFPVNVMTINPRFIEKI